MNKTKIPWADYTWNPIVGCSPASEGCANCYAAAISKRFHLPWGSAHFMPERLEQPATVRKPSRIFVCSMADLFHDSIDDDCINQVFNAMASYDWHTFIVLTKRPERMADWLSGNRRWFMGGCPIANVEYWKTWPLPNVWLGVTAETQARADERIPILLNIPAVVRFVSVEPMLEPIDLRRRYFRSAASMANPCSPPTYDQVDYLTGFRGTVDHHCRGAGFVTDKKLNWVIAGPETGPKARSCEDAWINALAVESPCFFDKREQWKRREFPV